MTVFPHGDRVIRGNCHWLHTPEAQQSLADLRKADSFAYGDIQGQIQESEAAGLGRSKYRDPQDHRCPLAFAPAEVREPPWLGELKASSPKGVEWRLYFGEPTNHQDHVVGVHLRDSKLGRLTTLQNRLRQRQHISKAMKYLKRFFADNGYTWANFPKGAGR